MRCTRLTEKKQIGCKFGFATQSKFKLLQMIRKLGLVALYFELKDSSYVGYFSRDRSYFVHFYHK